MQTTRLALTIAVVDMYATRRTGTAAGKESAAGSCFQSEIVVVDVVDTGNIAAGEDVSDRRPLTSLTPTNRGDLTPLMPSGWLCRLGGWPLKLALLSARSVAEVVGIIAVDHGGARVAGPDGSDH